MKDESSGETKEFAGFFENVLRNAGEWEILAHYLEERLDFSPADFAAQHNPSDTISTWTATYEKRISYEGDIPIFEGTFGSLCVTFCGEMDLSRADLADLLEKAKRGEANQSQARVGITLNFGIQREGEWSAAKPLYHVSYVVGDDKPAPYGDEDFIIGAYLDIQNEGSGI